MNQFSVIISIIITAILVTPDFDSLDQPSIHQSEVTLSESGFILELVGCSPVAPDYWCESIPNLQFTFNTLNTQRSVEAIQGVLDGAGFTCQGTICNIAMQETGFSGIRFEYWVKYEDGSSSEHFFGQVRIVNVAALESAFTYGWRVEIVSQHYILSDTTCCVSLWESLPPINNVPTWLTTPRDANALNTEKDYYFLAGRLIMFDYVNAESCPDGGVLSNNYASECGLNAARDQVHDWQNLFNSDITYSAIDTGVPSWLLKNLFAEESQFWPGDFGSYQEYGLGHLTEFGADSLLLWNTAYSYRYCLRAFGSSTECAKGYSFFSAEDQAIMRGLLVQDASAYCQQCQNNINLTRSPEYVQIFADALVANATQVSQLIWNITGKSPGSISSYEDLWRFTLANYTSGPGCLSDAMTSAWNSTTLTWDRISGLLAEGCEKSLRYTDKIAP